MQKCKTGTDKMLITSSLGKRGRKTYETKSCNFIEFFPDTLFFPPCLSKKKKKKK
jgi:hypothetical protein